MYSLSYSGSCEHDNEPLGFHKMLGISCAANQLLASQEGISYMNSVLLVSAYRVLFNATLSFATRFSVFAILVGSFLISYELLIILIFFFQINPVR
jgi:hypothetical protein